MMDDTDDEECPVCCEPLDATDKAVNYCDCGYRMCIWCWNKLMETAAQSSLAGKCPNCRAVYDKDKITMSRVDPEMVMEERKKQKQERKKNPGAIPKNRKDLAHIRVVQRNLVYAVGLPLNLCREELLQEKNYFGQFGRMKKVSVNRVGPWAQAAAKGATGSCYVTYYRVEDAVRCIDAVDGATWGGKTIKACFGTTKYCNAFLKNVICNNPDCLYLHDIADEADSFYKDEVQDGVQLVRQQLLESLKVRGKGGAAPPAANPPTPPAAAAKATLAATVVVANALAPAAAGKGGPATNAITIPLKRASVAQAPGAGTAWGTTPDAQSPAVTGLATWANAAAPKPPPATTGLLADQEWPSLAPTRDDDRSSDPDKPSEPIAATLTPARSGPWGEKPLSRASSMTAEAPAAEPPAPRPSPTPIPTPMPAAAAAAAAAAKQGKPKVITLTKPTKGKGPLVMAVGKGKAAAAAAAGPQMQQLGVPAAGPSMSGLAGDAKEGAAAQNGGAAAGAKASDAGAGAVASTPPATKKAGGKVVAVPVGGAGGAKGAAAAVEGVPSVTAAVAAATAAVVGTAAAAGDGERKEGGENGAAAAALAAPAGAGLKMVKGPPPGFTGRAPSATLPANIEPSVVAAVRAAANAAPSAGLSVAPQATAAATPPSIISPSDQPVASPPRPAHNGILSSLFRQQPTGTATPGPQPAPSPVVTQVPSLQSWVANPNGPAPAPRHPPSTGPPSSSSDHSLTFPTLPSAVPSPTLSPATSAAPAAKPTPARPPPGFSQPLYPTAKLGLALGAAPGGGSQGGDIDVNALFSHIPPTPLDDPWAATAASTAAVGPAAAPAQPIHPTPAPRLQSRFAFAREEAAPQQAQQPRPQQQPEELSRLFQKIAPGASVHVAHSPADPHGNGPLANGAFNPGTPHSPNPGMALLAQLQRKPAPTEAPPSTSAGPPKGPPPGMPATFADPAILTAGKNPLAAPSHFQQPPPGMGMPLGHHRPGELSLAGGQQGGMAAAGEPPGMLRAPARGPPPGFAPFGTRL